MYSIFIVLLSKMLYNLLPLKTSGSNIREQLKFSEVTSEGWKINHGQEDVEIKRTTL